MEEQYLFDVDVVQRKLVEYGQADSEAERQRIEGELGEALVASAYPDETSIKNEFPSGTALLAVLLELHWRSDDGNVQELVEEEIATLVDYRGTPRAAEFEITPSPYASPSTLMEYYDHFKNRDNEVARYFRLRTFGELGAFDDKGFLRTYDTEGGLTEELSEKLRAKLDEIRSE